MSNLLNFKFGKYTNLPETKTAGTVYVTTDNHAMYIDLPESHEENATVNRLRIGDINVYQSSSDANFKPPYQEGFYYFIGDNALMRYDGTAWTQINTTADIKGELDALEARVDTLEENLAKEIKRSTDKDAEHSKDISDLKDAVSKRVTTTEFDTFKQSNTEAINGAKSLAQEAQGAAGAAQSTADDALERANEAYSLAETKTTLKDVKDLGYATKTEAQQYAADVLGSTSDTSSSNTVYGAKKAAQEALSAANAAQDTADSKVTLDEVKGLGYATKSEAQGYANAVLGVSTDDASKNTVYGAKKAAAEALTMANSANSLAEGAKGAADAAQSTADDALERADEAYGLADSKVTLDEVKGLGYATKTEAQNYANAVLGTSSDTSSKNTVYGAKKAAAEALSAAEAAQDTVDTLADNVLLLNGTKAMTGNLQMGGKQITGLANPTNNTDAATKQYVDNSIAANDAMTFIGTVGEGGDVASLPTTANKGDTYKVNSMGTYGGIAAKVGDLFINKGEDGATANWSHISSGYEDDYLQKIISEGNVLYLTDGVNLTSTGNVSNFTVVGDKNSNLQFTVSSTNNSHTITGSMAWGTF